MDSFLLLVLLREKTSIMLLVCEMLIVSVTLRTASDEDLAVFLHKVPRLTATASKMFGCADMFRS